MRVFPNGTGLLLGLLLTFFGAWKWPNGALWLNTFFSNSVSQFAVVLVFLIQGWNLNANRIPPLIKDYRNVVLVQGFIFLGPLIFVLFLHSNDLLPLAWKDGFIFLAVLPTTISSCVVYTSMSNGDSDFSLGHATLSNFLALLWVPLACSILIVTPNVGVLNEWYATGKYILPQLFMFVLLPCFVGWLGRKVFLGNEESRFDEHLKRITFGCILFLAYLSLSKSILLLGEVDFLNSIIFLFPFLFIFLLFHLFLSWYGSIIFSKSPRVRVAKFFCISQKSLAMGLPLAGLLFAGEPELEIQIICPLILYHFLQLVVGACFISPLKRWVRSTC